MAPYEQKPDSSVAEKPTVDFGVRPEETEKQLLAELTKDYDRLRRQKARKNGGIEGRALINIAFVNGEQWLSHKDGSIRPDEQKKGQLYLVFNLIGPKVDKLVGRVTAIAPVFQAQPDTKDIKALQEAETVDTLITALDEKLDQPAKTWETVWTMAVMGTAFEYVTWVPNAAYELAPVKGEDGQQMYQFTNEMGESIQIPQNEVDEFVKQGVPQEKFEILEEVTPQGEVGSQILSPLQVFVDQSVRDLKNLAPDQRVYIAQIKTVGWAKENYPDKADQIHAQKDFQIVSTNLQALNISPTGGMWLKDLIPTVQGSADDTDPEMVLIVESYAPRSQKNPEGRKTCFIPGQLILLDEVNPYEDIPLVDFHFKPVTTNFWTMDFVTPQIPGQRFLNKRVSQLGEQANYTLYSDLLLGPMVKKTDIKADEPGVLENGLNEAGVPMVQRREPPQLPQFFMDSIPMVTQLLNDTAGGQGLMEDSKFPGQMRGPLAVPMLQEILDTEWGPLFNHIGERMARVKQMRLDRVRKFYPPIRTLHYVSKDQKQEVLEFHNEKILGGGINYKITVQRAGLLPELRALRENRVASRLTGPMAILYLDERTGQFDKSKIAQDLAMGDTGRLSREAQWRKYGAEVVEQLQRAENPPLVAPFENHRVIMDELEAWMSTMEYRKSSPMIQQAFIDRWNQHREYLVQEAQAQQMAMQNSMVHDAVAQSTQQAAAKAAAMAVEEAMTQSQAQKNQPTGETVANAFAESGGRPPSPKKRTLTVKREETS